MRTWFVAGVLVLLVLNRRTLGTVSIDAMAQAIGYVESRGNYQAVGPATDSGHRAYGKYQVLDTNIGPWTQRALGRKLTPAAFLNDQVAQDVTVQTELRRIMATYSNPADVASIWFSGQPFAQARGSSDVTGTTVPEYVNAVLARL